METDYTKRRGTGLFENEVSNVFHLATLPDTPPPYHVVKAIRDAERGRLADRVEQMLDEVITDSGFRAGWNAALEAVFREIFSNAPLTGYHKQRRGHVDEGPVLSRSNWSSLEPYAQRGDGDSSPSSPEGNGNGKGRNRRKGKR